MGGTESASVRSVTEAAQSLFFAGACCYTANNLREYIMKRLLPLLLLGLLASTASAYMPDEETVLDEEDNWNLYTKLGPSYSDIGNDSGFWGTLEVGTILNNKLALGLRASSLLQGVNPGFDGYSNPDKFDIFYGGLNTEYTWRAEKLWHASLAFFVGAGQLRLNRASNSDDDDVGLFVVEPAVNVMVNLSPRSEIGLGLGYRYTDINDPAFDDEDLSGLVGSLFLRLTNN